MKHLARSLASARSWLRRRREQNTPTEECLRERDAAHDAYIRGNAAASAGPALIK